MGHKSERFIFSHNLERANKAKRISGEWWSTMDVSETKDNFMIKAKGGKQANPLNNFTLIYITLPPLKSKRNRRVRNGILTQ